MFLPNHLFYTNKIIREKIYSEIGIREIKIVCVPHTTTVVLHIGQNFQISCRVYLFRAYDIVAIDCEITDDL